VAVSAVLNYRPPAQTPRVPDVTVHDGLSTLAPDGVVAPPADSQSDDEQRPVTDALPALPGCGRAAGARFELYADVSYTSLDGSLYLCDQHGDAHALRKATGLTPYRVTIKAGPKRCGDGYDFLAGQPLAAPPAAVLDEELDEQAQDADLEEMPELVAQAVAGDRAAFGEIYALYYDKVYRFVYGRCGNRQLAEDLAQDTFVRALKRIDTYTWERRDIGAWFVTIARNALYDHYKSGRYRLEVLAGDTAAMQAANWDRDTAGDPEAAAVDGAIAAALWTAVDRLTLNQRQVLVLRFFSDCSVAETARFMGRNEGAVKALQYRAIQSLTRALPKGFLAVVSK
jgi:RNA polymerase sigma factor (sigma-70 family)